MPTCNFLNITRSVFVFNSFFPVLYYFLNFGCDNFYRKHDPDNTERELPGLEFRFREFQQWTNTIQELEKAKFRTETLLVKNNLSFSCSFSSL